MCWYLESCADFMVSVSAAARRSALVLGDGSDID